MAQLYLGDKLKFFQAMFGQYLIMNSFNRSMASSLAVFIFIFLSLTSQSQDCIQLSGTWINQDSSILHVDGEVQGKLFGTYQSNASDDSSKVAWTGLINRNGQIPTLSFTISWADYGSITSWTGYCTTTDEIPTITTMWHLVRPYTTYDWERFVTNQSIFIPQIR